MRKDREAAAKKLREFLAAGDDTISPSSLEDSNRTKTVSALTKTDDSVSTGLSGVKVIKTQTSDLLKAPTASLLSNKISLTSTVAEQSITNSTVSTTPKDTDNVAVTLSTADTTKIGLSALKTSSTLQSSTTKTVSFAIPPVRTSSNEGPGTSSTGSLPSDFKLGGLLNVDKPSASLAGSSFKLQPSASSVANTAVTVSMTNPGSRDSTKQMQNTLQQPQQLKLTTLSTASSLQFGTAPTTQQSTQQSGLPPLAMTTGLQFGVASTQSVNIPLSNSVPSMQSSIQLPQKPALTLSGTNNPSLGTAAQGFTFKVNSGLDTTGPGVQTQPGSSTTVQKPGGMSLIPQKSGGLSLPPQKPGVLSLAAKPGLSFGVQDTLQPSGGLLFGNGTASTQIAASQDPQKPISGLLFGKNTTSTQSIQQPNGGLLFGNGTAITQGSTSQGVQQPNGGLLFGNNTATAQATTTQGIQQPSGGLLFGINKPNDQASASNGVSSLTGNASLSFGVGSSIQPNSMFGIHATNQGSKATGLLFGNPATQPSSSSNFSFSASSGGGSQQQSGGIFSSGNAPKPQSSLSFNFGGNNQILQKSNSIFNGGANMQSKENKSESKSFFGGTAPNASSTTNSGLASGFNFSPAQVQPKTSGGLNSGFSFSAGGSGQPMNQLKLNSAGTQQPSQSGQLNFGQNGQSGFNFGSATSGMGIGQNQNSSGFAFNINSGTSNGQSALNPANSASKMSQGGTGLQFGMNTGQGTGSGMSNIFSSPQPGLQTGTGFSFTPSAQQTPSQGFNFSATTPNNSSVSFGVTPTNLFAAGTQSESTPRNTARARRRTRKK